MSGPVYQSSYTKHFGHAYNEWCKEPRQGEIVGCGCSDGPHLYQFQGDRWVMVWGTPTDPDPTDPGSPWPGPVPAVGIPDDTWVPGDPARDMWMSRLFGGGSAA